MFIFKVRILLDIEILNLFQVFEHSHNGKLLDTDMENIKEKLLNVYPEHEKDNSMTANNKTKIIDLNFFDSSVYAEKDNNPPLIHRSNTTSLHINSSLMRDLKLSTTRKEV